MLQMIDDFLYTLLGGWWLYHNDKWIRIKLLATQVSIFQGKVYIFKKNFDWEFPVSLTCGIISYRGWNFKPVLLDGYLDQRLVYVTLTKRIKG